MSTASTDSSTGPDSAKNNSATAESSLDYAMNNSATAESGPDSAMNNSATAESGPDSGMNNSATVESGPDSGMNNSAKVRFSPDSSTVYMDELKESFGSVKTLKITGNIFGPLVSAAYCPIAKCVYVTDTENHRICKIDPHSGHSSVFAGTGMKGARDGPLYEAQFNSPRGIAMDPTNGDFFIADMWNHSVRKVSAARSMVTTVVGSTLGFLDGPKNKALLAHPYAVALNHLSRDLFITDYGNKRIRVVPLGVGPVTTIAGTGKMGNRDGQGSRAQFLDPTGLVVGLHRHDLFVADEGNNLVRRVTQKGMVETYAGRCRPKGARKNGSAAENNEEEEIPTFRDGPNYEACFHNPLDLAYGTDATVYLADRMNHRVRSIAYGGTYEVSTLAGTGEAASKDGARSEACLKTPSTITINTDEGYLYVLGGEPDAMRIVDIRYQELANRVEQPGVTHLSTFESSKTTSPKKRDEQPGVSGLSTFERSKTVELVAFGTSLNPQTKT